MALAANANDGYDCFEKKQQRAISYETRDLIAGENALDFSLIMFSLVSTAHNR